MENENKHDDHYDITSIKQKHSIAYCIELNGDSESVLLTLVRLLLEWNYYCVLFLLCTVPVTTGCSSHTDFIWNNHQFFEYLGFLPVQKRQLCSL